MRMPFKQFRGMRDVYNPSRRRILLAIFLAGLLVFLCSMVWSSRASSSQPWYCSPAPCKMEDKVVVELVELARMIHQILNISKIDHWLCYGTLWGALRNNKMLPWDDNVDFCARETVLTEVAHSPMKERFFKHGIKVEFGFGDSTIHLTYKNAKGKITAFDFGSDKSYHTGWFERVSSRSWIWGDQDAFPGRLVEPPLPTVKFYGIDMPVPRENLEIQKYHYPNDWWRIMKPKGC